MTSFLLHQLYGLNSVHYTHMFQYWEIEYVPAVVDMESDTFGNGDGLFKIRSENGQSSASIGDDT